MANMKKKHSASVKAHAALAAIREEKTKAELSAQFGVHSKTIQEWKRKALNGLPLIFSDSRKLKENEDALLIDELYRQIGQLKVELDWVKKKSGFIC